MELTTLLQRGTTARDGYQFSIERVTPLWPFLFLDDPEYAPTLPADQLYVSPADSHEEIDKLHAVIHMNIILYISKVSLAWKIYGCPKVTLSRW